MCPLTLLSPLAVMRHTAVLEPLTVPHHIAALSPSAVLHHLTVLSPLVVMHHFTVLNPLAVMCPLPELHHRHNRLVRRPVGSLNRTIVYFNVAF